MRVATHLQCCSQHHETGKKSATPPAAKSSTARPRSEDAEEINHGWHGSTRIRNEKNGQLQASTGCSVHCQHWRSGKPKAAMLGLLTTVLACASFRATDSRFSSSTGAPSGPSLVGGKEGQGRNALQSHSGPGTRQGLNSNIAPRERLVYRALALPGDLNRAAVNGLGSPTALARREAARVAMRVLSAPRLPG